MMRLPIAIALSTAFLTACAGTERPSFAPVLSDDAKLTPAIEARASVPAVDAMPALMPFTIPAGTIVIGQDGVRHPLMQTQTVVPFGDVLARERVTTSYMIDQRAVIRMCKSAVQYQLDFNAQVRGGAAE